MATFTNVTSTAPRLDQIDAQLTQLTALLESRARTDEDMDFITRQLTSIMQGTRTDIIEMRTTLRQLAALIEQSLRARVHDEERWQAGDPDRRNGDRRREN